MTKLNFQQPLYQSSVSQHMLILCSRIFLNINVENSCAAKYFCGNHYTIFLNYLRNINIFIFSSRVIKQIYLLPHLLNLMCPC